MDLTHIENLTALARAMVAMIHATKAQQDALDALVKATDALLGVTPSADRKDSGPCMN